MKFIILLAIIIFVLYVIYENFFLLTVRREKLGSGVKIVHLSDLHRRTFGADNEKLCRMVRAEKPDIIIFSGDLVSRSEKDFSVADKTLGELCSIAPVYMIYGNHEQSIFEENVDRFERMLEKNSEILLKNGHADVEIRGRRLKIYGLLDNYGIYKKNDRYRDIDKTTKNDMEKLLGKCPDGEVLLIAHNPFFGEAYEEWGAKYTFSGHVHGGTVRLFGIAMLSPERKFFPGYSKGVYSIGGMKLLVSAGLGKFRLFDPPEIVVYEI
ncbi:MAG: metallophosphoesterase [Ruminococcus sp.]|nr:metallophosphoesterase [Ruminococcus sp.]